MLLTITNIDINRQGLLILDLFFFKKKESFMYVCSILAMGIVSLPADKFCNVRSWS